jgi:acyl-CoA synthetase (AMP-forming)/AMP-acid ligase II
MTHGIHSTISWPPDVPSPTSGTATLVELLRWRAQNQPQRLAYRFLYGDSLDTAAELTHQQLDRRATALAARLIKEHMPGERVLLLFSPGIDYIVALYACLYAGLLAVPLYPPRPGQTTSRVVGVAKNAQATLLLTTKAVLASLADLRKITSELGGLQWFVTDEQPEPVTPEDWLPLSTPSRSAALILYTSGSTEVPRGVVLTHRNLMHNLGQIHRSFPCTPDSSGVIWLPPYHDMGLIGGLLEPLFAGCPVTLMSPVSFIQNPFRWLEAISRYRATTSGGPNFAYELCIEKVTAAQRAQLDLSCWRVAFNGSEPIHEGTLARFTNVFSRCGFRPEAWHPCYGLAEATLFVSGGRKGRLHKTYTVDGAALEKRSVVAATTTEDNFVRLLVSSGLPAPDLTVLIVDPETQLRCPENRVGEIWVAGPSIAAGYWNQASTTKVFGVHLCDSDQGPFLRTGDLGFLKDGELFVTGRIKDLIIIRGLNYYPHDIERSVQESHPSLRRDAGAAFSIEVDREEHLIVVQEVEHGYQEIDVGVVTEAIRAAIAQHHNLRAHVVALLKPGTIPKTSSGKIQRYECRERFITGTLPLWRQR